MGTLTNIQDRDKMLVLDTLILILKDFILKKLIRKKSAENKKACKISKNSKNQESKKKKKYIYIYV